MTAATMDCLLNIHNDTALLMSLILEQQPQSPYSAWYCIPGYSGLSQVTVTVHDYNGMTQTSSDISLQEVFVLEQLPLVTVMEPTSTLLHIVSTSSLTSDEGATKSNVLSDPQSGGLSTTMIIVIAGVLAVVMVVIVLVCVLITAIRIKKKGDLWENIMILFSH